MIRKVNAWLPLGAVAGIETETGGRLCGYVCHMNTLVRNHFRTEEFVFVQPVSICINHKGNSFNENYMIQLLWANSLKALNFSAVDGVFGRTSTRQWGPETMC